MNKVLSNLKTELSTFLLFFILLLSKHSIAQSTNWSLQYQKQKVFIENKGQFNGLYNGSAQVLFASDFDHNQFLLTKKGIVYRLSESRQPTHEEREKRERELKKGNRKMTHQEMEKEEHRQVFSQQIITTEFENGNPNVTIEAVEEVNHYYTYGGNNINIPKARAFKKVIYKNIYNQIDVVYEFHPKGGIEYSFILHPQANPNDIKINYHGMTKMSMDANKNILLKTRFGNITEHCPQSFYSREKQNKIESKFSLKENKLCFQLDEYDHSQEITIDPWVQTPNFNTVWDCVWECEKDAVGNAYIIGGVMPMQLLKYNSAGALQWTYSTPYDTANGWLGTFATDDVGNSYVTNGSTAAIQKVNNAGALVWNNGSPGGLLTLTEFWTISFNCDQSKLVIGGTDGTLAPNPYIFDVNINNGNIISSVKVTGEGNTFGIPPDAQEVRAITACGNSKYYFLTHDSIGYIHQSLSSCGSTSSFPFHVSSTYNLGYKCENWRVNNTGIEAIKSFGAYVYTHRGNQVHKRNFATGAIIATASIPSGSWITGGLGENSVGCSGIDIDSCGNVYVGTINAVIKYDGNLNQLTSYATSFNVYDVTVSSNGDIIACGSVGDYSSGTRAGYVQVFAASACKALATVCCDPSICQVPSKCITDAPFNLVATTPGGTWSGTGITNASLGTFSPAVSGVGTFKIYYTLPCGRDSVNITVNTCSAVSVCKETNGNLTVSGGTAPYTWSYWQAASTINVTNAATCTTCGGTWNSFVGQCLNGIFPVTSCTSPAGWVQFATGTTVTPPAGKDTIKVVDNAGTTWTTYSIASVTPCNPCNLAIQSKTVVNPSCGLNNGSISLTMTGGTTPYSYTWTPNVSSTNSASNLAPGNYVIHIAAGAGCSKDTTITLPPSYGPKDSLLNVVNESCANANDGAISIQGTASTFYTLYISNILTPTDTTAHGSNSNFTSLADGTYIIWIKDQNYCWDTVIATVQPGPVCCTHNTFATGVNPSCTANNGSITFSPSGGTGPYTYTWSPAVSAGAGATNLGAGTYHVTVRDVGKNCNKDTIITLVTPNSPNISGVVTADPTCAGQSTGQLTAINYTGGLAPYTYGLATISTPGAFASLTLPKTNMAAGTYIVRVTDANGCKDTFYFTIGTGPACCTLAFQTILKTQTSCGLNNGAISITMTGGTMPYTYTWTPNVSNTNTASNLSAGSYSIHIDAGVGCSKDTSIAINASTNMTLSTSLTQPNCISPNTGAIDLSVSGLGPNYTYSWSNLMSTQDISSLTAGSYSVTVSDQSTGCTATTSATLNNAGAPTFTLTATNVSCFGLANGSATISNISGGTAPYTFAWSSGDTTISIINKPAATYTVTVTPSSGGGAVCPAVQSITITEPNPLNANAVVSSTSCGLSNASINLNPSGGNSSSYSYTWNPNVSTSNSASNLPFGTYSITVNSGNGCVRDTTINIPVTTAPSITSVNIVNETCLGQNNGSFTNGNVTGGSGIISWGYAPFSNPTSVTPIVSFPVNNLTPGTYIVGVRDASGCTDTTIVTISAGPNCCNLSISAVLTLPPCGSSTGAIDVTINGVGPYNITWDGVVSASEDKLNIPAGNYHLHIIDNGQLNCSIDSIFSLSNAATTLRLDSVQTILETCLGDNNASATVFASGGVGTLTCSWSNGLSNGFSQTGLSPGNYSFTVADGVGCSSSGNVSISAGPLCCTLVASATFTNPSCLNNDGSITANQTGGNGAISYSIDGGAWGSSSIFGSLASGTHTIIVQDANGCKDTVSVTLTNPANNISVSSSVVDEGCNGSGSGEIHLTVNGAVSPFNVQWSAGLPNGTDQTSLTAGTYSYTVTDANNCSVTGNITVAASAPFTLSLQNDTVVCASTVVLDAGIGNSYNWSDGSTSQTITVNSSGTYQVTVTNADGCTATDSVNVIVYQAPVINLPDDTTILPGQKISLDATVVGGSGSGTYLWTPDEYISCTNCPKVMVYPIDSTKYVVHYTDNLGCETVDFIQINVDDEYKIYIPNAFSPNGDSRNDVLYIYTKNVKEFSWNIYNRWGEKVFESHDLLKGWDGTFKGVLQNPAVYVYVVSITYLNGKTINNKGSVTLVR